MCTDATKQKTLPGREGNDAKVLPFALTGGFGLFLALNAGLFIMLALTNFLKNAAAGALPLKPFERTFQGLIFADTNLGHSRLASSRPHGRTAKPYNYYTAKNDFSQCFFKNGEEAEIMPSGQPFDVRREYGNADGVQTGRHPVRNWR